VVTKKETMEHHKIMLPCAILQRLPVYRKDEMVNSIWNGW